MKINNLIKQHVRFGPEIFLLVFFLLIDFTTRIWMPLGEIKTVKFDATDYQSDYSAIANEDISVISIYLDRFRSKPVIIEKIEDKNLIESIPLSIQGGIQNEIFVKDYKIELLAIVNEQNGKQFVVLNETYLIDDSTKVVKYENNDKVHGMKLIISSMTEVQFSHPELARNVVIKMYSNKKKSSE